MKTLKYAPIMFLIFQSLFFSSSINSLDSKKKTSSESFWSGTWCDGDIELIKQGVSYVFTRKGKMPWPLQYNDQNDTFETSFFGKMYTLKFLNKDEFSLTDSGNCKRDIAK